MPPRRDAVGLRAGRGALGLCAALALALCLGACGSGSPTPVVIGAWGGQFDEATRTAYLREFDAADHAAARLVDASGEQFALITAQEKSHKVQWDAVDSLDGGAAYRLYHEGLLLRLPGPLYARLRRELGAANVTPFGFAHGGLAEVLVCNMARIRTCPADMTEFYNDTLYPQPRMFSGIDPIEGSATAEVGEGWRITETDINPIDPPSLFTELGGARSTIRAFWRSGAQQLQIMRSGEADLGIMWSDLAYQLAAEGVPLKIKWLGGAYEPRYWAVLKGAPHVHAALGLLAWIAGHPAAEARWAGLVHASVPSPAARALLPASLLAQLADNPVNRAQLAMPNLEWYALYGGELDNEYRNFVAGRL
jgi:putative spermidine/putrescine transport system substrate-binding protein